MNTITNTQNPSEAVLTAFTSPNHSSNHQAMVLNIFNGCEDKKDGSPCSYIKVAFKSRDLTPKMIRFNTGKVPAYISEGSVYTINVQTNDKLSVSAGAIDGEFYADYTLLPSDDWYTS